VEINRKLVQADPTPLLGLIYCRLLSWDARQLDEGSMCQLCANMLSCLRAYISILSELILCDAQSVVVKCRRHVAYAASSSDRWCLSDNKGETYTCRWGSEKSQVSGSSSSTSSSSSFTVVILQATCRTLSSRLQCNNSNGTNVYIMSQKNKEKTLNYLLCCKFPAECTSERITVIMTYSFIRHIASAELNLMHQILIISRYLATTCTRVWCLVFYWLGVYTYCAVGLYNQAEGRVD